VEPTRFQKDRKANEWLVEKQISRSWEKELEGVETYCQRQEKMEGTHRQPMFLMEGWTLLLLFENERHPESILELPTTIIVCKCLNCSHHESSY
jgi:hypothetical protein